MAIECSYYLEPVDTDNLAKRFLEAFAAILGHSNYAMVLDAACRVSSRCGRCTSTCPVYQVSEEQRDIPCERSELLLKIYRRYFTPGGALGARFGFGFELDEAYINRLAEDVYRCPAGEKLTYRMTSEQDGKMMRLYWTNACPNCPLKSKCRTGNERRIPRWEHEHVLEAAQRRLDENPQAMRERRETVEHPFGTLKMRMGSVHFLMKRLPKVATEMALHVLAYNITRAMNIMGVEPLIAAMRA